MRFSSYGILFALLLNSSLPAVAQGDRPDLSSRAGLPLTETASRGVVTRDPSTVVKCKGEFWVFYTGRGIPSFHSKDLVKWEPGPHFLTNTPPWAEQDVPEHRGNGFWAP